MTFLLTYCACQFLIGILAVFLLLNAPIINILFGLYVGVQQTWFMAKWIQREKKMKILWDLDEWDKVEKTRIQYSVSQLSIISIISQLSNRATIKWMRTGRRYLSRIIGLFG